MAKKDAERHAEIFDQLFTFYDVEGNAIGAVNFVRLKAADPDYGFVAADSLNGYHVHTCWVGQRLNLSYRDMDAAPHIFESMIVGKDGEWFRRYSTQDDAVAGHATILDEIRLTTLDPQMTALAASLDTEDAEHVQGQPGT